MDKNIPPSSIAVITFYKDQQRLLEQPAACIGVRLHTVDSVQGYEMDTCFSTRLELDWNNPPVNSLDDLKRMNVALTRCRHGLFILGHVTALRSLSNWARILRRAAAKNVIISPSSLPELFFRICSFRRM
ncbi:hypothetical protein OSTOST_02534, partial [Ostertagia ostertagi]